MIIATIAIFACADIQEQGAGYELGYHIRIEPNENYEFTDWLRK